MKSRQQGRAVLSLWCIRNRGEYPSFVVQGSSLLPAFAFCSSSSLQSAWSENSKCKIPQTNNLEVSDCSSF